MRVGKNSVGRPAKNQGKKTIMIILIVLVTAALVVWVYSMGRKAEETVEVCMTSQNIYKNQVVTESMLQPYEMLRGEFEKFSVVDEDGTKYRRIVLWEERGKILNTFAAYPIQANNYCEYRSFITSRIDNSDNVLYSFPGKVITSLDVGESDLGTFATFLQPGDRVNIVALFKEEEEIEKTDEYGEKRRDKIELLRTEQMFSDIIVADLLNQNGNSVLDIYADYRDKTAWQQSMLDNDSSFQESVEPSKLLLALTPDEYNRYLYYISKNSVEFRMSLPQRVE